MRDPDFLRGRRVFLTGHTGFKGAWLSLWLEALGASVRGYALAPPTQPNLFDTVNAADGMDSVIGDIRDLAKLREAMTGFDPEVIIHMAAQPLVRESYQNPVDTYSTNVMGTVHVLECARACPSLRAVVNVTTDKCYENREWLWGYREDEPMGGRDPYSNSKGCSELVTAAYRQSFFSTGDVAVASARAGNVIGGGDWAADRLVPDALRAFESGQPLIIRNPLATRPWQHVLEPLSGYLTLAESLWREGQTHAGGWNFGPHTDGARTVESIVDKLITAWGEGAAWTLDDAAHPHEARELSLDISKARACLGWEPKWDVDSTLVRIVRWHKAWREAADMRTWCLAEITAYTQTKSR
jgi:CDP-glucose 4,6-dehydratase